MTLSRTLMLAVVTAGIGLAGVLLPVESKANTFVTIGTGGVTGVYYPTGGAICRLVNRGRAEHGIRCSVESTGGSVYNLTTIRTGELALAVAQSDAQFHAYHGSEAFADQGANPDLRSIFSLHAEPFTVVARSDADITDFDQLRGKRVNIGNPGSGQRATIEALMDAKGWSMSDFAQTLELRAAEQSSALCDDRIDAMLYVVGHPSGAIQEATTTCSSRLVNVMDPVVERWISENSYFRKATIPGGMYRGNDGDVTTFGVAATLVTSAGVPDEVIYQIVKAVFENFEAFTRLHPAFENLKKEEMVKDALSAPLHSGAERYYREMGLL